MRNWHKKMEQWRAMREAEARGEVADSMEARKAIMARFHAGKITLDQAQAEVAKLKRGAKRSGKVTRNQALRGILPLKTEAGQ